ncbi:Plasmodium exported protein, unknown function [Plasmodium relictum]|uniref:Reticulocyte binding protein n=1 Tax=Plasmodium relictum TaxID=85471 RepID=A0A1J1GK81_PLARL|nr:Plasmodium exported protein, unknown function [Plasmodium relictum]CRG84714.1 Plasmodium exported protein, unknown function [Plasmodium relictum]
MNFIFLFFIYLILINASSSEEWQNNESKNTLEGPYSITYFKDNSVNKESISGDNYDNDKLHDLEKTYHKMQVVKPFSFLKSEHADDGPSTSGSLKRKLEENNTINPKQKKCKKKEKDNDNKETYEDCLINSSSSLMKNSNGVKNRLLDQSVLSAIFEINLSYLTNNVNPNLQIVYNDLKNKYNLFKDTINEAIGKLQNILKHNLQNIDEKDLLAINYHYTNFFNSGNISLDTIYEFISSFKHELNYELTNKELEGAIKNILEFVNYLNPQFESLKKTIKFILETMGNITYTNIYNIPKIFSHNVNTAIILELLDIMEYYINSIEKSFIKGSKYYNDRVLSKSQNLMHSIRKKIFRPIKAHTKKYLEYSSLLNTSSDKDIIEMKDLFFLLYKNNMKCKENIGYISKYSTNRVIIEAFNNILSAEGNIISETHNKACEIFISNEEIKTKMNEDLSKIQKDQNELNRLILMYENYFELIRVTNIQNKFNLIMETRKSLKRMNTKKSKYSLYRSNKISPRYLPHLLSEVETRKIQLAEIKSYILNGYELAFKKRNILEISYSILNLHKKLNKMSSIVTILRDLHHERAIKTFEDKKSSLDDNFILALYYTNKIMDDCYIK